VKPVKAAAAPPAPAAEPVPQLPAIEKKALEQARLALEDAAVKLKTLQEQIATAQKKQIARLAVEIARKILARKIEEKDYEIESIVEKALGNFESVEDVTVYLNPDDITACRKAFEKDLGAGGGIKFVADPNLGPAQCRIESPRAILKSSIDEQLARVAEALEKA